MLPLYAVYDLDVSPLSFDFFHFLIGAREKAAGRRVHVVICPGMRNGWRSVEHKPITDAEREWRLHHILLAGTQLCAFPVTLAGSRMEAGLIVRGMEVWPEGWRVDKPVMAYRTRPLKESVASWQKMEWGASKRAKQFIGEWLETNLPGPGQLITITLRETHTPTRNSNIESWLSAADRLADHNFRVVIVRDTEKMAAAPLSGWPECSLASCDMDIRMALYESAAINLGRNGGPVMMLAMAGLPYLLFGVLAEPYFNEQTGKWESVPTPGMMASFGLPVGSQLHDAKNKRFIWESDDNPDLIVRETLEALS